MYAVTFRTNELAALVSHALLQPCAPGPLMVAGLVGGAGDSVWGASPNGGKGCGQCMLIKAAPAIPPYAMPTASLPTQPTPT